MLFYTPTQQVGTVALILTCLFAFWRGNRVDKLGATLIAVAWLITPVVEIRKSWYQFQIGMFIVDTVTLIALVAMAIRFDRRWPICAAAFQSFAVLTHVAFMVNPHALYRAYLYANFGVSYLLLGSLIGGVIIEPRERPSPSRTGAERDRRPPPQAHAKRPA